MHDAALTSLPFFWARAFPFFFISGFSHVGNDSEHFWSGMQGSRTSTRKVVGSNPRTPPKKKTKKKEVCESWGATSGKLGVVCVFARDHSFAAARALFGHPSSLSGTRERRDSPGPTPIPLGPRGRGIKPMEEGGGCSQFHKGVKGKKKNPFFRFGSRSYDASQLRRLRQLGLERAHAARGDDGARVGHV